MSPGSSMTNLYVISRFDARGFAGYYQLPDRKSGPERWTFDRVAAYRCSETSARAIISHLRLGRDIIRVDIERVPT